MAPRGLGAGVIDAVHRRIDDRQREPAASVLPRAHELASPEADSGTCFEHCSPIRTRCPGPAAQMSLQEEGRWMPICRRAAS
jgi:hypothetical protein